MACDLRRRLTRPCPCPSEPTASHRQGSLGRKTSGGEETWSRESNRDGANQGGEEADGLGPLLGGELCEVGRCQLDLLLHVITGRLGLTKPALSLGFRAESRRHRL